MNRLDTCCPFCLAQARMDWFSGELAEWPKWKDAGLLLAVGLICFLAGWWCGRRPAAGASSIFSAMVRHLHAHRITLWMDHARAPRSHFREELLQEARKRIRERSYWKERS